MFNLLGFFLDLVAEGGGEPSYDSEMIIHRSLDRGQESN